MVDQSGDTGLTIAVGVQNGVASLARDVGVQNGTTGLTVAVGVRSRVPCQTRAAVN